jgi:hypothetical protein
MITYLLHPITRWDLHRIPVFVAATAALSNIVSNVPAVMLLRTLVPRLPDPHRGWLALAMSSTLAGNLTITGSVAKIIVVERARAEGVLVSPRRIPRVRPYRPAGNRGHARAGVSLALADSVVGLIHFRHLSESQSSG